MRDEEPMRGIVRGLLWCMAIYAVVGVAAVVVWRLL